jgi:hypothetical protein
LITKENNMTSEAVLVEKVRDAIGDRAMYLAFLLRSYSKTLSPEQVEAKARKAIYQFGQIKGQRDQVPLTPEAWVDHHVDCGGAALFESRIIKNSQQCEVHMTYCPLMAAWKKMDCTPQEMDWLCDIAMEVDRGRADYHGIPYVIDERMAKGDSFCRLVLKVK